MDFIELCRIFIEDYQTERILSTLKRRQECLVMPFISALDMMSLTHEVVPEFTADVD